VEDPADEALRTFKTAWFAKAARKAHLTDEELCSAIQQLILGQADDLEAVYTRNAWGKISTAPSFLQEPDTSGSMSICFAKQDRANIQDDELAGFRRLVKAYAGLTTQQVNQLLRNRNWMEICNDGQT
jgi:hypothetical protein